MTNSSTTTTPYSGEIKQSDLISTVESWLNTPSGNILQAVGKIVGNFAYSMANSPFSLITGRSLGGQSLNSEEKVQAFIDVVPGLITGGLTKTGAVVKTSEKGLKGFNQFVKQSNVTSSNKSLPQGMKWQENASKLFKSNETTQQGLKDSKNGMRLFEAASVINGQINNE